MSLSGSEDSSSGESEPTGATPDRRPLGQQLRSIATDLFSPSKPSSGTLSAKEIVNGLDRRESMLGLAASLIVLVSTIASYLVERHSNLAKTRQVAPDLLIAGIVLAAVVLFGTLLKRRALLGFGAFMAGFEMITGGNITGVVFLAFGGWLVLRVMRRQRQNQASGTAKIAPAKTKTPAPSSRDAPGASKRYTPPRQRAGARRK